MKKIMVIFGTRPEAIKMCPLVKELKLSNKFTTQVCVTGQHREMLQQVLDVFKIIPDYDLGIMKEGQTLFSITISILEKIKPILEKETPDIVLVHGDTSTTFASSLAAFYLGIKVGHIEAGLRTYDLRSPFPEEYNRQAVSLISDFNFAPTQQAKDNLIKEGHSEEKIFVTGNTAIDALKTTISKNYHHELFNWIGDSRLIMLTAHRRENLGIPMENMFKAVKRVLEDNGDVKVIYPIHKNPAIRKVANRILGGESRIKLIEPLEVIDFHNFLKKSCLILTDSGGIQEEAPSLGKPVLVMRDTTERPEGVAAGTLKLVGTDEELIYKEFTTLLSDKEAYTRMSRANNPYGDGTASEQIVSILENYL
ncbi:non-hydrolyzing UDP-N-acetylglucosamine 2-epimerase [Streptococcus merionis]|uniref:non-hydrolyzing UDP-N-acetylglucosamine 2-epimerase n=1 Tax=Streptococcus merionis TaxID=400065 RepID=UPI003512760E